MDIALKMKRAVASIAAAAMFASTAVPAFAQFSDVPSDHWAAGHIQTLVDDGVVDGSKANYYPNNNASRIEIIKMIAVASDALAGYEAPATPTYSDLAASHWGYDYAEALTQLGVIQGYSNAQGEPTGVLGTNDNVTRDAIAKMAVGAFAVAEDLTPAGVFKDVPTSHWSYPYVTTAYNQTIVNGYTDANGDLTYLYGPANPVTRAEAAKIVDLSRTPVDRETTPEPGEECPEGQMMVDGVCEMPASTGDLEVSLSSKTPASSTLPLGATSVSLASFDFTADSDDVQLTNLVVTRGGVGLASDLAALYLYEGANRITTERTLNAQTNQATFPIKDFVVESGTTRTLTLVGEIAVDASASSQHYFYLSSAADVSSNAIAVGGDFPVAGNTFTMGGASTVVNTATLKPGTAPSKVTLGEQDAEVASLRIEAGAENDLAVHSLAFTQGGSLASDKMSNLRLVSSGGDELATAEGFMGDLVTFSLVKPMIVEEGQTRTVYVHADVNGGRSTDTLTIYFDVNQDAKVLDQQYGFGAAIDNQFTLSLANIVALEGGDVTVTDNGPAATQVATESTNNELLNYSVTSARDLTVRNTNVLVTIQDPNGNKPTFTASNTSALDAVPLAPGVCSASDFELNLTSDEDDMAAGDMILIGNFYGRVVSNDGDSSNGGLCVASASNLTTAAANAVVTEKNAYEYVEDIKIIDLDEGFTVAGPMTKSSDGSLCTALNAPTVICPAPAGDDYYAKDFTEDYELIGGETRHFSLQTDIGGEMVTGYQIRAAVQYPDNSIKDLASNEFVPASQVIGAGSSALAGDFMIVAENSLAISTASTPTSNDYVKGDTAVPALGISMAAGDAGDITLKRLDVRMYANASNYTATSFVVDTAPAAGNYEVCVGSAAQIASDAALTVAGLQAVAVSGNQITLTTGGFVPDPGDTVTFDAVADGNCDALTDTTSLVTVETWADAEGNTAANTIVSSITLYDGNDVVAGPESIDLVDAGNNGYTAGTDYYVAQFDSLDLVVAAGSTKTLVAKVNLLNTASATNYLALDVVAGDINAEDDDADTITASGGPLNGTTTKVPLITVLTSGALTASSEGNPDADILITGATEQLVSKYKFTAVDEDFMVKKLTIVNDLTGNFGDNAALTSAVSQIIVKYPNADGVMTTKSASLSGTGEAKFSGLDFLAPAGEDVYLEVYANINTKASVGPSISGKKLRLGLKNTGNDITTFEAIGQASSTNINFTGAPTTLVTNSTSVDEFVVRRAKPVVTQKSVPTKLTATTMKLFDMDVTVDGTGSVDVARMVFDITLNGAGALTLSDFQLLRNGAVVNETNVDIYSAAANLQDAGTVVGNNTDNVVVTMKQSDPVIGTANFQLKANVATVSDGDTITVRLRDSDEVSEATGLTGSFNANTGQLISSTSVDGIFTDATDYQQNLVDNIASDSFIWSDASADPHTFTLTDGASSRDYTNGYLLDINELDPVTLSENN